MTMRIKILTLFPEMFLPVLGRSITGRAIERGILSIEPIDIRAYTKNKHNRCDDYPYGGGAGLVMTPQPIYDCFRAAVQDFPARHILLSPRGKTLTQQRARELAQEESLIFLCGHYEGVDQRAVDEWIDEEISIGDYVLTGGELAAMVVIDCLSRHIPGVLGSGEELSPGEVRLTSGNSRLSLKGEGLSLQGQSVRVNGVELEAYIRSVVSEMLGG